MTTREIVERYFESLTKSDAWTDLISSDMVFTGVRSRSTGREEYVSATKAFLGCVESVAIVSLVVHDNQAAVIVHYVLRSKSGKTGNVRIAEFFETGNGQISCSTIFFDTAYFFEFINN